MPLFQQRKPRQFTYKSRLGEKGEPDKETLESQWDRMRSNSKRSKGKLSSLPVLLLLFIMVLILMYILRSYE